jgi:rSAM/selenodomain-associated transferase 1
VAVAIMAKWPRAGQVKTRLSPPLDAAGAAALYRGFLLDKIEQVRALEGAEPALAYTPAGARADFAALARGFTLVAQQGPDLGTRLHHVLGTLLAAGHTGAIAIDSDTPTLPVGFLQQAVDLLGDPGTEVVLGPTEDGGYYLIGLKTPRSELFQAMPWSTPGVLDETLRRTAALGLRAVCLPSWFDVDTPEDLERLRISLATLGAAAPRHTAACLVEGRPPRAPIARHPRFKASSRSDT